jgi:hypothetical protein
MNSENNNNPPQSQNTSGASAATMRPRASDIAAGLVDGDNPLDFINKNLARMQPEVAINPEQVIKDVEAQRAAESTPAEPPAEAPKDEDYVVPVPDVSAVLSAREQESTSQEDTSQEPEVQDPKQQPEDRQEPEEGSAGEEPETNTTAENFKNLRGVVKETKQTLKEREEELETTKKKLKQYEDGEAFPDVVQELQSRISELERYEQLVSLKTSPQYKEKFLRPLTDIKEKLATIAKDYDIPEEVMTQAMSLENKAELNRFLSSHFDEVGALEVKGLVTQAADLEKQAKEAEKEPETALDRILQDAESAQDERRKNELAVMSQVSKDAWIDSLVKIREEGTALELIHKDGDSEYNGKFVDPIIKKAASEYGKLVALLSENGLEKLPKDLAYALSRMCQLAHASAVAVHTRNDAVKHIEELEDNVKRTTNYIRPQLGATNGGGSTAEPVGAKPTTTDEASDKLLKQVGLG